MAFRDFISTNKVKEYFPDLIINKEKFIPTKLTPFEIKPHFQEQIDFGLLTFKPNEAFADKFLITPILNNVWLQHRSLNIWTQTYIKADDMLQGRPDYMVSPVDRKQFEVLSLPIIVLVVAKQENFSSGWGQCLAEMLACQKLNKAKDVKVFGVVSTGQFWEFGVLEQNVFIKDIGSYSIINIQQTINAVNYIFEQAENEIPKLDLSIVLPENEDYINEKGA